MARYPSLYQINTRVWLRELSEPLGRPAALGDIPDKFPGQIASLGCDYVWFLGLWQTGAAGRQVSLSHSDWLKEFQATLPGFTEADVSGSPFAVTGYTLHRDFGQEADLSALKERLRKQGLKFIVDFVPNHTALARHSNSRLTRIMKQTKIAVLLIILSVALNLPVLAWDPNELPPGFTVATPGTPVELEDHPTLGGAMDLQSLGVKR